MPVAAAAAAVIAVAGAADVAAAAVHAAALWWPQSQALWVALALVSGRRLWSAPWSCFDYDDSANVADASPRAAAAVRASAAVPVRPVFASCNSFWSTCHTDCPELAMHAVAPSCPRQPPAPCPASMTSCASAAAEHDVEYRQIPEVAADDAAWHDDATVS